ncbi:MAG: flagellar hook capping FlgD N-terminal domain-containing protein [Phycisphaerae bacterium]
MVTSVTNSTSGISSASSSKMSSLSPQDFLKIMLKEMQQQDPMDPVSSKDMINQISQIRDIQSSMDLSQTLKDLAVSQKLSSASALLGKEIAGLNSNGEQITGLVTSIKRDGDTVSLELDSGQTLSIDNVIAVNGAKAATPSATSTKSS